MTETATSTPPRRNGLATALLAAVFCIATAGLVYELVAGTAATYLVGDSVTMFSFVIGFYLFAMGGGSYLSRFINGELLVWFVRLELLVGVLGGFSATLLFVSFSRDGPFQLVLALIVGAVGVGVGLEIPLLIRILEGQMTLRDLLARVLFFDYLGALAASLLFPLLLVPKLGLIKASLLLGLFNAVVGGAVAIGFGRELKAFRWLLVETAVAIALLSTGLFYGERLTQFTEDSLYPHEIALAETTRFQRIVVTRSKGGETRLYLSGHLQFSSLDEYRYHEALVHPALAAAPMGDLHVLVLGGGDGLAARELLTYPDVRDVTLVDLDPAMTRLFSSNASLAALNRGSLTDPRVTVVNADALGWIEDRAPTAPKFDVVIVDFPDPSSYAVGKLYTRTFYLMLRDQMAPGGVAVVQSTSPLVARRSFWCIETTMHAAGFDTRAYHTFVPSFGSWGYVLAGRDALVVPRTLRPTVPTTLRFLSDAVLPGLFVFPADMAKPPDSPVNRLNDQALVRLYEQEWHEIVQ